MLCMLMLTNLTRRGKYRLGEKKTLISEHQTNKEKAQYRHVSSWYCPHSFDPSDGLSWFSPVFKSLFQARNVQYVIL